MIFLRWCNFFAVVRFFYVYKYSYESLSTLKILLSMQVKDVQRFICNPKIIDPNDKNPQVTRFDLTEGWGIIFGPGIGLYVTRQGEKVSLDVQYTTFRGNQKIITDVPFREVDTFKSNNDTGLATILQKTDMVARLIKKEDMSTTLCTDHVFELQINFQDSVLIYGVDVFKYKICIGSKWPTGYYGKDSQYNDVKLVRMDTNEIRGGKTKIPLEDGLNLFYSDWGTISSKGLWLYSDDKIADESYLELVTNVENVDNEAQTKIIPWEDWDNYDKVPFGKNMIPHTCTKVLKIFTREEFHLILRDCHEHKFKPVVVEMNLEGSSKSNYRLCFGTKHCLWPKCVTDNSEEDSGEDSGGESAEDSEEEPAGNFEEMPQNQMAWFNSSSIPDCRYPDLMGSVNWCSVSGEGSGENPTPSQDGQDESTSLVPRDGLLVLHSEPSGSKRQRLNPEK